MTDVRDRPALVWSRTSDWRRRLAQTRARGGCHTDPEGQAGSQVAKDDLVRAGFGQGDDPLGPIPSQDRRGLAVDLGRPAWHPGVGDDQEAGGLGRDPEDHAVGVGRGPCRRGERLAMGGARDRAGRPASGRPLGRRFAGTASTIEAIVLGDLGAGGRRRPWARPTGSGRTAKVEPPHVPEVDQRPGRPGIEAYRRPATRRSSDRGPLAGRRAGTGDGLVHRAISVLQVGRRRGGRAVS